MAEEWNVTITRQGGIYNCREIWVDCSNNGELFIDNDMASEEEWDQSLQFAKLLAAAPDLLAACEADDAFFTHYTDCPHCGPGAKFCPKAIILCAEAESKRKTAIAKAKGE